MTILQDDIVETGSVIRIRVFTKNGNEFSFTGESVAEARLRAEDFKRGYRAGARDAANAALSVLD